MDKSFRPTLYNGCNYLCMLELKLIYIIKRGPMCSEAKEPSGLYDYSDLKVLETVSISINDTLEKAWPCYPGSHYLDVNSSPLGQNGRHFADDIFRCIFVNE